MESCVSIIIPTYNRAHLISETLNSVMEQSYANWECIVVDDGSHDETEIIVKDYITTDKRIKYYNRPEGYLSGGNGARNFGLKVSKGDYIQFFDSDDIMFPKYLESRMHLISLDKAIDVLFSGFTFFYKNGKLDKTSNTTFSGDIFNDLVEGKISFSPPSFLLKKKTIESVTFDEKLRRSQDLDFFFKVFTSKKDIKIKHLPDVLFKVRKHADAIGSSLTFKTEKIQSRYLVNQRILEYFKAENHDSAILIYKKKCLRQLKLLLENRNHKLVISNIFNCKSFNYHKKLVLLLWTGIHFITGRGSSKFNKLKLK